MKILNSLYRLICVVILAQVAIAAMGWGQKGHDVTAAIAQRHLTPRTEAVVDSLLSGKSMVYWANWLDNASHTPEYAYSRTWHYKNIDPDETYESASVAAGGDVIIALTDQCRTLRSGRLDKAQSALALKMIIHLMGDMHQPMHMGRRSDRGGNNRKVSFFDRETNLHSVWDSYLPEASHKWSYTEWVDQLDRVTPAMQELILQGDFNDWGKETYSIACDVYAGTPEGTKVEYDYIARWTPVVEQQYLKGGLRLAFILNSIFDLESTK